MHDTISKLFRKDSHYFGHIEGLRSLSALRVMLTHIILMGVFFYSQPQYLELLKDPAIKLIHLPSVFLDSFFFISGLVIAYSLFKSYKNQGRVDLYDFFVRRGARILPLYILTCIAAIPLLLDKIQNSWANVFFINNYLSIDSQYVNWAWAIAVEVQFYFIFGIIMWLLSKNIIGKKICQLLILAFFLSPFIMIPIAIMKHHFYHLSAFSYVVKHPEGWLFFDVGFDKLSIRSCSILYGVMTAYVFVYHKEKLHALLQKLSSIHINTITLSIFTILIFICYNDPNRFLESLYPVWQTSTYWVLLIQHQLFSLALCGLIILADAPKGILMVGFVKILNSFLLRFLGRLSYTTYMIHPLVFFYGYQNFFLTHKSVSATQYTQYGLWLILITYLLAIPCYLFLECPVMENIKQRFLKPRSSTIPLSAT